MASGNEHEKVAAVMRAQRPYGESGAFATEQMLSWIAHQSAFGPRRAGTDAGLANERYLLDQLKDIGLENVRAEPIDVMVWNASTVELSLADSTLEAYPIPYCAFTPEVGVEAPLVFAGHNTGLMRADWRGKIVVAEIRFPMLRAAQLQKLAFDVHDPDATLRDVSHPATWIRQGWHLYRLAAERGAAGFIGVLVDQPGGSCRMYAPYGFREADILDKPIPGVWVGRAAAPALRQAGRAKLTLCGTTRPGITHNLVGEVSGTSTHPDAQEAVVLSCHHDSPFVSPVEDASGVAVVLAIAKHCAATRALHRRLVVLLSAGHFYGSIGTRTFIKKHASFVANEAVLEVSLEHIAREAREDARGRLVASGLAEPSAAFVSFGSALIHNLMAALKAQNLKRVLALPAAGPFGAYPPTDGGDWYEAGVPVVNFIANPVYLLTDDDAMDWVDVDRLPLVAAAFADLLRRVDGLAKSELKREDLWWKKLQAKAIGHVMHAKATALGLKPLY